MTRLDGTASSDAPNGACRGEDLHPGSPLVRKALANLTKQGRVVSEAFIAVTRRERVMSVRIPWMLSMGLLLAASLVGCGDDSSPVVDETDSTPDVAETTNEADSAPAESDVPQADDSNLSQLQATDSNVSQAQAVAEVERLGGKVTIDEKNPKRPVKGVDLAKSEATDAELECLKALTSLAYLRLDNTQVTDAGLEHLKGLTDLRMLRVANAQVTDAGLEHLEGLTNLIWLDLSKTWSLSGKATSPQVTDAGLEHLKGLTNLKTLILNNTDIGDNGLKHLEGLTNLEDLALNNTHITDAGIEHLSGLTSLGTLELNGTKVTDAGLEALGRLSSLRQLSIGDTQVTEAGVANLKKALPKANVTYPVPIHGDTDHDFRVIYLAYSIHVFREGRPPGKLDELAMFYQWNLDELGTAEKVKAGEYVVVWNEARVDDDMSAEDVVLVYEKDAPNQGGIVGFADGSVRRLTADQFQAALRGETIRIGPLRSWTDITGQHTTEAGLVDINDGVVRLRRKDGQVVSLEIAKLSFRDQRFLRDAAAQPDSGPTEDVKATVKAAAGLLEAKQSRDFVLRILRPRDLYQGLTGKAVALAGGDPSEAPVALESFIQGFSEVESKLLRSLKAIADMEPELNESGTEARFDFNGTPLAQEGDPTKNIALFIKHGSRWCMSSK